MPIIADTPESIAFFRLAALKSAVTLESHGMKRRGLNATSIARKEFGLSARAPHKEVIAAIKAKMDEAMAKRTA